jgi:O-antigen/teichoic acid export membrane protein
MASIRRNLIANYLGQGWSAVASVAFIPLYIRYLGIESYGLVGIFTIVLAAVSLCDGGMTPTLNREMARFSAGSLPVSEAGNLLRSMEGCFLVVFAAMLAVGLLASPWLSDHWIGPNDLPHQQVVAAMFLMLQVSSLRLFEGLYRSALLGLQKHVWLNVAVAILATVRSGGAVLALMVDPTIITFFAWQAASAVLSIVVLSCGTYAQFRRDASVRFHFSRVALAGARGFAGGVFASALLGVALTQLDKVLLSRLLSLEAFAYYTLAATIANALYQLVTPIAQSFYPRFTEFVAREDHSSLARSYHAAAQLMSLAVGPAALTIIFFAHPVLLLWTKNPALADNTATLLSMLAAGTLLHGLQYMPYMLQLAHGWSSFAAKINVVAVAVLVPAILWVVPRYGAVGAALIWIALNLGYLVFSIQLMHRRLLPSEKWRWYLRDVALPLGLAALAGWLLTAWPLALERRGVLLAQIVTIAVLVYAAAALASPQVRVRLLPRLRPKVPT